MSCTKSFDNNELSLSSSQVRKLRNLNSLNFHCWNTRYLLHTHAYTRVSRHVYTTDVYYDNFMLLYERFLHVNFIRSSVEHEEKMYERHMHYYIERLRVGLQGSFVQRKKKKEKRKKYRKSYCIRFSSVSTLWCISAKFVIDCCVITIIGALFKSRFADVSLKHRVYYYVYVEYARIYNFFVINCY